MLSPMNSNDWIRYFDMKKIRLDITESGIYKVNNLNFDVTWKQRIGTTEEGGPASKISEMRISYKDRYL